MTNNELSHVDPQRWMLNQERKHLVYLKFLRIEGYEVDEQKIEKLERDIREQLNEIDLRAGRDFPLGSPEIADLQERLVLVEALSGVRSAEEGKVTFSLEQMPYVKLRIRPDRNHQRAHFHIEYKQEYSASYAVDTFEVLAGGMPRKHEKAMLEWARDHKRSLLATWERLKDGEDVRELVIVEEEI